MRFAMRFVFVVITLVVPTACGAGSTTDSAVTSDRYGLATAGTITAGVSQGDAPFVSPDASGKPVGMLVDLNDEIAKRMGLRIVYKLTTISGGLLSLVTAGHFDMMLADL